MFISLSQSVPAPATCTKSFCALSTPAMRRLAPELSCSSPHPHPPPPSPPHLHFLTVPDLLSGKRLLGQALVTAAPPKTHLNPQTPADRQPKQL